MRVDLKPPAVFAGISGTIYLGGRRLPHVRGNPFMVPVEASVGQFGVRKPDVWDPLFGSRRSSCAHGVFWG